LSQAQAQAALAQPEPAPRMAPRTTAHLTDHSLKRLLLPTSHSFDYRGGCSAKIDWLVRARKNRGGFFSYSRSHSASFMFIVQFFDLKFAFLYICITFVFTSF
jgi:hypothetical protein